jgi:hypothetical protein
VLLTCFVAAEMGWSRRVRTQKYIRHFFGKNLLLGRGRFR